MMTHLHKGTPRLYVDHAAIASGMDITLHDDQTHYLKTVLRLRDGDKVRCFNGQDGEFLASWMMVGKKSSQLTILDQLRLMPNDETTEPYRVHLFFPLIKKDRQDWLIEKAVELGVTDLHPILTDHVIVRDINRDRVMRQIIEAAEQSERLDIPHLHPLSSLKDILATKAVDITLFVALERCENAPLLSSLVADQRSKDMPRKSCGFLCGPEGGFSAAEAERLQSLSQTGACHVVNLGPTILRAETAALYGLIMIMGQR